MRPAARRRPPAARRATPFTTRQTRRNRSRSARKLSRIRMRHVLLGQRELDARLHQIVADRNLAAKRVAPPGDAQLVQVVRIGLNQHGHVEPGQFERVGHALFVAEIRQHDEHAVDFVAMPLEQLGALAGIGVRLDAAELRFVGGNHDRPHAARSQQLDDVLAGFGDELIGKEIAIADDDAKRRRSWCFCRSGDAGIAGRVRGKSIG